MEEILFVFIFVDLIFVGAVILKSWLRSAPKKDFFGIVIKVFDGDTVLVQSGFAQAKVRLAGEDAPEPDQRNGLESQRFLMNLILGKRVFVKVIDTDGYGRTVGLVYFGKDYRRDASFEVISAGWVGLLAVPAQTALRLQEKVRRGSLFSQKRQNRPLERLRGVGAMELQEAEQEPPKTLFQLVGEDFIRVVDQVRKAGECLSKKTKPGWARALVNLNNSYEE